jgi:hypothetical protein
VVPDLQPKHSERVRDYQRVLLRKVRAENVVAEAEVIFAEVVKLKRLTKFYLVALLVLVVTGCSGSSNSSTPPTSTNPTPASTPLTPPSSSTDSDIPNLTNAVAITGPTTQNFQGLEAIAGNFFSPLVGTAQILMSIPNQRAADISASTTVLIVFEDAQGLWGLQQEAFSGAATLSGNTLDVITSDVTESWHIVGSVDSNQNINGTIYYRIRQSGETECENITVTCTPETNEPNGTTPTCGGVTPNPVPLCEQYMSQSSTQILGTFTAPLPNWWVSTSN